MSHAGSDIPVDGAHFIPRLVLPDLFELHSLALEHAPVFPGEDVVHCLAGVDLKIADLFGELARDHGTSTAARISSMMSSDVFSSASAS